MKISKVIPLAEELVCDTRGTPIVMFHGTPSIFDEFCGDYIHSVGFHFGDREQAEYRVRGLSPRRIVRVYLRRLRGFIDIRGTGDPGWENPAATALALVPKRVLTVHEQHRLGLPNDMRSALRKTYSSVERRRLNLSIAELIKAKGFDGVTYDNQNEPKDGKTRDAYCVFNPAQIVILDYETFP